MLKHQFSIKTVFNILKIVTTNAFVSRHTAVKKKSIWNNAKKAGGSIWCPPIPPPVVFRKIYLLKRGRNLVFFFTFNIILKTQISWKFHWISSSRSEDMEKFSVNISYFQQFFSIFWIFWHYLVTKKLKTSAYNRWYHHFFTFNIL